MTVLPSPIPHPLDLSPWDLPGWAYEALEWVIGIEWPAGDERAVWDLADGWFAAASALAGPRDDATSAAVEVMRGYAAAGLVADAFDEAWRRLSDGDDAPLTLLLTAVHELGGVVEGCGADIEAAKLEVWIEVGLLVIELIGLAVAVALTAGAASPAAAAAMTATRMAIQRIFQRLVTQMSRKAVKTAVKQVPRLGAGRFARRAGLAGLAEAAEEVTVDSGTQLYQNTTGRRDGLDLRSVGLSALGGFAGGAGAAPAALGRRSGHLVEGAFRSAGAEVLGETTASLATGTGLPGLDDAGRAATSGVASHSTEAVRSASIHSLAASSLPPLSAGWVPAPPAVTGPGSGPGDLAGAGSAFFMGGAGIDRPGVEPLADGAASGRATWAEPPPVAGVSAGAGLAETRDRGPVSDSGDAVGVGVALGGLTAADTSFVGASVVEAEAGHGADRLVADSVGVRQPDVGLLAGPPAVEVRDAGPAVVADDGSSGGAPVGAAGGETRRVTPSGVTVAGGLVDIAPPAPSSPFPADRAPEVVRGSAVGPPRVDGSVTVDAGLLGAATGAGGGGAVVSGLAVHGGKPIATTPVQRGGAVGGGRRPYSNRDEGIGSAFEAELERLQRDGYAEYARNQRAWHEHRRRERASEVLGRRAREWADRASAEAEAGLACQRDGRQDWASQWLAMSHESDRVAGELAGRARAYGGAPPITPVDAGLWRRINNDVGALAPGGVETGPVSALTGSGVPPPIDASRGYGLPGGLRPPLALHQRDLERAMPRTADGAVMRTADPREGTWFALANDGGPAADPTRAINCQDCVLSFYETWLHGRPRVSAPRTFDSYQAGDPERPLFGEQAGMRRAEEATGGRYQTLCAEGSSHQAVSLAFSRLHDQLTAGGHGSVALIVNSWEGGSTHAWAAVNQNGTIVYVDPQLGRYSENVPLYAHHGQPYPGNVVSLDALVVGPDGRPMPFDDGAAPGSRAAPGGSAPPLPSDMLRDPTADEMRDLGVGLATYPDLGLDPESLSPDRRARLDASLPRVALVAPEDLRFTQRSVSPTTRDGVALGDVVTDMRESGWRGEPIHGVRWGDGSIVSLDNRRLRTAREAGLQRVPVVVHHPSDRLADSAGEWPDDRVARNALREEIRELPDGTWRVGGDEGVVVYARGSVPVTYADVALFRAAHQRSLLPSHLFGTSRAPVLFAQHEERSDVDLNEDETRVLAALWQGAEDVSESVQADLESVTAAISAELALPTPLALTGTDHRVKTFSSLARKYDDEARLVGRSVQEFASSVNDVLRFSVLLPDGLRAGPIEQVVARMSDRGYVVEPASVKNFWRRGNRFFGINMTVRAPNGQRFEIQFPTAASLRASKLTHDLYKVVRRQGSADRPVSSARRVHAFLEMLAVNKRLGLPDQRPPSDIAADPSHDATFAKWIAKKPEVWAEYKAWLDLNNLTFADVVDEFALDVGDFPIDDRTDLGDFDVQLLRDLRHGGAGGAGGDHRHGRRPRARGDVGPQAEGMELQPGARRAFPG